MNQGAPANIVLVDTDVYSYLLNGKGPIEAYRRHLQGKHLALSFITIGELYFGKQEELGNGKNGSAQGKLSIRRNRSL